MSALPPENMRAMRDTARRAAQPVDSLVTRWEDLHRQGAELADLARLAPETSPLDGASFTALLSDAHDWQRDLAWQGIEDIAAMMQPGLAALRIITARGQDASAPALALWREFHAARGAVLHIFRQDKTQAA